MQLCRIGHKGLAAPAQACNINAFTGLSKTGTCRPACAVLEQQTQEGATPVHTKMPQHLTVGAEQDKHMQTS
eukprot:scaffold177905_cov21-Tisochrysis_lutea.AAC.1